MHLLIVNLLKQMLGGRIDVIVSRYNDQNKINQSTPQSYISWVSINLVNPFKMIRQATLMSHDHVCFPSFARGGVMILYASLLSFWRIRG